MKTERDYGSGGVQVAYEYGYNSDGVRVWKLACGVYICVALRLPPKVCDGLTKKLKEIIIKLPKKPKPKKRGI